MVDNFVLVAPRPMRIDSFSHRAPFSPSTRLLSPPIDPFSRAIRTDAEQTIEDETTPSSGRNTASPRYVSLVKRIHNILLHSYNAVLIEGTYILTL